MQCPDCPDSTLVETDEGLECQFCLQMFEVGYGPCPDREDGEECYSIDNAWGGYECAYCGRDM